MTDPESNLISRSDYDVFQAFSGDLEKTAGKFNITTEAAALALSRVDAVIKYRKLNRSYLKSSRGYLWCKPS